MRHGEALISHRNHMSDVIWRLSTETALTNNDTKLGTVPIYVA